ncbi:type I-E CRISPR-associated protein Cas5/CasD [Actinacidiphila sp. ITFR-21]|uniref:type I-E CRISPR-associated protein Cas5/CasD n=1 Tax=Actinacidiphila sp. ITFR-21 TaxID=3075199 RepID=UPI00288C29AD|nr:type I-E CRISPR-associated protein Cas5/CasD [Streptomyces sp. ITFR-21]WNI18721.1 type I-E CRISPR-associated protein Cas5/CasD [Streptomyces sp. ITFR-21]
MSTATLPAPDAVAAEPGLLLRLAGPLQSWGEHSHFNERDTAGFPTRSGVLGLLAAGLGRGRDEPVDDLTRLSLTVRTDRPGVILRDLHTVGGGLPAKATVTTAEGKKRTGDTGTLLTHRYYLADATFTVALTIPADAQAADSAALLRRYAQALRSPQWPLFLGRRSCPPEGPVLLGASRDALHHLVHLPLTGWPPRGAPQPVEFLSDRPLDRLPVPVHLNAVNSDDGTHTTGDVKDDPVSFHPRRRSHRARPLYRRSVHLSPVQYAGLGTDALTRLSTYLNNEEGSLS